MMLLDNMQLERLWEDTLPAKSSPFRFFGFTTVRPLNGKNIMATNVGNKKFLFSIAIGNEYNVKIDFCHYVFAIEGYSLYN